MAENENADVEEWQSLISGPFGLARWNDKGERAVERIEPGSVLYVTPEERRRNQTICRDSADDPFTNGSFRLLRAVEGDANSKSMASKVKAPVDDELERLLEATWSTFEKKVKAITEPMTLDRLYRLARRNEAGAKKIKVIGERIKELNPNAVLVGDNLAAGRENAEDERPGPVPAPDVDGDPKPREYADI